MPLDLKHYIRKRSRNDWVNWAHDRFSWCREWLQAHGEVALLLGIVAGIVLVLAFKLMLVLVLIVFLASVLVWWVALPEDNTSAPDAVPQQPAQSPDDPEST